MNRLIFLCTVAVVALTSCGNANQEKTTNSNQKEMEMSENNTGEQGYRKVEPGEIPDNVIKLLSKEWMLITAGNDTAFNGMTASWGAFGHLWNRPVAFIMVRDTRYTYEFLQKNDYYTLSFFDEKYRDALTIMGTKSGRDSDKVKEAGLTPLSLASGLMSFAEARMIVECRKLYADPFKKECFTDPQLFDNIYNQTDKSIHTLYVGEIVNVWIKK
ncbi:MAG: flavin reductase [Bacteroidales bacterium]|jgi:flavin reductase (DIM6/NTAB) family NADH-FMN oxidoreductase RutF|nr:flavin reductase [Bacteroidales bacterium]